jgi:hypothetical protein
MTASPALQPLGSFGGHRINGHRQPRPYHRAGVTHTLDKLALLLMAIFVAIDVGFAAAVRRLCRNAIPQPSSFTRSVG